MTIAIQQITSTELPLMEGLLTMILLSLFTPNWECVRMCCTLISRWKMTTREINHEF